jgi:hypothetical protein
MKTNIEVLDNPNPDASTQRQIVKSAISYHEKTIRDWLCGPKRDTRAIQSMVRQYNSRLEVLRAALDSSTANA